MVDRDNLTTCREEYDDSHLVTAVHYERFDWETMEFAELCSYSVIVFYDADGTAAANIFTILHKAFNRLKEMQVTVLIGYCDDIYCNELLFVPRLRLRDRLHLQDSLMICNFSSMFSVSWEGTSMWPRGFHTW